MLKKTSEHGQDASGCLECGVPRNTTICGAHLAMLTRRLGKITVHIYPTIKQTYSDVFALDTIGLAPISLRCAEEDNPQSVWEYKRSYFAYAVSTRPGGTRC